MEQSLLGEKDVTKLGIIKLDVDGTAEDVVQQLSVKSNKPDSHIVSGGQTQQEIDANMAEFDQEFSSVFSHSSGKFVGDPIKIHMKSNAITVVQPPRGIPLHYVPKLKAEIDMMLKHHVIEGTISEEHTGTIISNLVTTDKKNTDRIRVTLDCQAVNKAIYANHKPIPTPAMLWHQLKG